MLIDRFLEDATEVDVDAIRDHTGEVLIGGVMEHVEEAGVHSGDSACAIPPQTLPPWVVEVIESYTTSIAKALDVRGLINVQYAVLGTTVYVIEANPRASRTVPFVAKATGVPLAKVASRVMLGATLAELRDGGSAAAAVGNTGTSSIKEAVLPFNRFPEVDTGARPGDALTGEVMGIDTTFGLAFYKAELAAGTVLPDAGHGVPVAGRRRQARRASWSPAAARARARHRRDDRVPPTTSASFGVDRRRRSSARSPTATGSTP